MAVMMNVGKTRQFDLNQISGVNIITSYWMGPRIAHTLVSFDFANSPPLTFQLKFANRKMKNFPRMAVSSENTNSV